MKALSLIIIMISSFCLSIKAQDTSTEKKDGQQLSELLKSDYNKFFNLEEKSREKAGENSKIHYKTGGFQEFVDIYISIDKSEKIIGAELKVKREWMKGANLGFAKDVVKSFIGEFAHDKKHSKPLVDKIWQFGNDEEPELKDINLTGCFNVFIGKTMGFSYEQDGQMMKYNNLKLDGGGYVFAVNLMKV